MHPVKGMPGSTSGWNAANDTGKTIMPDGTVLDSAFLPSPDKKTISFKVDDKDKTGHDFHQTQVYDRTK